jgi:hypothetical protein
MVVGGRVVVVVVVVVVGGVVVVVVFVGVGAVVVVIFSVCVTSSPTHEVTREPAESSTIKMGINNIFFIIMPSYELLGITI